MKTFGFLKIIVAVWASTMYCLAMFSFIEMAPPDQWSRDARIASVLVWTLCVFVGLAIWENNEQSGKKDT